jgi:quercetin dioxygenase-like cupin family protein
VTSHRSNLRDLGDLPATQVWEGIRARVVEGDQLTFAVVELEPNAHVPEHTHPAEQNGMVITGEMRFRIGDEERLLGPGGTWRILGGVPHEAHAGPDGAVVIDTFAPVRRDWHELPRADDGRAPRWP